ncbi:NUDIX domain-containing protein [Actinomadura sp. ATCC 31491]|uniref:NUDIX domain-containing protein n=1 Tax=Actinomadura luzonensis TaxID=2805427 RepID=A0ABT0FQT6_9ACTN|nr:NUDIX domain-containing protein [Actinomadura luzonensis]MCK2214692.1 NUDIX domain-containing protein [Actinomadura luzonensis]
MGFDGFLVPDWAKPYVGYAVGMDWPEGDEDGCFRLADACAHTAQTIMAEQFMAPYVQPGDDWDGEALKAFRERVDYVLDPALRDLLQELFSAAFQYNDLGVQVQYTKRMIEVSVWFLIFQLAWLLAAANGPWGALSLSIANTRIQLTRLAIAQLGRRLLINIGLFGGLMAGMDLAVQASQSRRDHLDWEQILASGGTGALLGTFLTGFTGLLPARSMWGLMARSAGASAATDLTTQLASGRPLDWDRLFKSLTSGALGGADAHWASWNPLAHGRSGAGPSADHTPPAGPVNDVTLAPYPKDGHSFTSSKLPPSWTQQPAPATPHPTTAHPSASSAAATPTGHFVQNTASHPFAQAAADSTTFAGAPAKQDISFKSNLGVDALINGSHTADPPAPVHSGDSTVPASAKPPGFDVPPPLHQQSSPGPFRILENPGKSGDGYLPGGQWGKYGAAGVLIRAFDEQGQARYLLMQQSEYVSNAGKWQLPGGALDSLEKPINGAARELSEELGVGQDYLNTLQLKGEHAVHVGDDGWTYTNLAAEGPMFEPSKLDSFETSDARWFTLKELNSLANNNRLHPALAKALPDILALYHQDAAPPAQAHYTPQATTHAIKPPVDFGARTAPGDPFAHPSGGKPAAYSGLVADGPHPSTGQVIHRSGSLYFTGPAPHVPVDSPFGSRLVGPTFGDAVWADVYRDLTLPEQEASRFYAGHGYIEMNGFLRKGDSAITGPTNEFATRKAYIQEQIELLNGIMHRQPVPATIDVFRSVDLTADLFTVPVHELPGTVQHDPGFFSTNLGDSPVFHGNVNLHLRVPPGTPAFYLQLVSRLGEQELLLGTGVSWLAEDVQRRDGVWHVYGWVLPPGASGAGR